MTLKVEGMTKEDEMLIADVIENGKFEYIYDVVDEYVLVNKT